jgi:type II secretory pathway pseudopilin PulG
MKSSRTISKSSHAERGYILITLILFVALLVIAAGVMAPIIAFQVKRDREEELIHRGVQYSRAMKHFVKKFGRYPTRIEELENTNQVRFLRRRYKDPITGKDFKILHMGDVQLAFGAGIAGGTPVNGLNPGAPGAAGGPGALGGAGNTLAQLGGLGANGLNAGGLNSGGLNGGAVGGKGMPSQNSTQAAGEDTSEETPATGSSPSPDQSGTPGAGLSPPGATGGSSNGPQGQVFGGGPMVGVASTSRDKSIRVFNKKDHYYQWQFIYDPNSDRGGLLTTPNQPALVGTGTSNAVQTGAPGAPGAPGGFGGTSGQPNQGVPQAPPGMQTPQLPPDQTEQ